MNASSKGQPAGCQPTRHGDRRAEARHPSALCTRHRPRRNVAGPPRCAYTSSTTVATAPVCHEQVKSPRDCTTTRLRRRLPRRSSGATILRPPFVRPPHCRQDRRPRADCHRLQANDQALRPDTRQPHQDVRRHRGSTSHRLGVSRRELGTIRRTHARRRNAFAHTAGRESDPQASWSAPLTRVRAPFCRRQVRNDTLMLSGPRPPPCDHGISWRTVHIDIRICTRSRGS